MAMLVRKIALVAAIATVGLLGVASASASTALRMDPGGTLLSGATTVTNTTSDPASWISTGWGTTTGSQTFADLDVGAQQQCLERYWDADWIHFHVVHRHDPGDHLLKLRAQPDPSAAGRPHLRQ
jgi:hypothetical protein